MIIGITGIVVLILALWKRETLESLATEALGSFSGVAIHNNGNQLEDFVENCFNMVPPLPSLRPSIVLPQQLEPKVGPLPTPTSPTMFATFGIGSAEAKSILLLALSVSVLVILLIAISQMIVIEARVDAKVRAVIEHQEREGNAAVASTAPSPPILQQYQQQQQQHDEIPTVHATLISPEQEIYAELIEDDGS